MLTNNSEERHETRHQSQVDQNRTRTTIGLLVVLATVIGIFHLLTLTRFPSAFVDEAWTASRAWGWLQTGQNFGTLDAGVLEKLEGYWTFLPLAPTIIHAAAIELFGLSLASLRLVSLVSGMALALAVFIITFLSTQSRLTGFVAVLLLLTSYSFTISSHLVRPDIFAATLGFSSIASYFAARRTGLNTLYAMCGLLLGLAFEVHINAVIYGPVLIGLFLVDMGWRFISSRAFWAFAVGIGLGLAIYLLLHVVRYPDTYLAMSGSLGQTHAPPLFTGSLFAIANAFREMGFFLGWYSAGRVAAVIIAVLAIIRSRSNQDVRLVVMLIVALISFALLINTKLDYYMVFVWPFADIVIAVWIVDLFSKKAPLGFWAKRGKALGLTSVGFSVIFLVAINVLTPPPGDAEMVANRIRNHLKTGDTIMGSQTYWFGLTDYSYLSWEQILSYQNLYPGSTIDEALQELSPDVMVLDHHMRLFILPDTDKPPEFAFQRFAWERRLPKEEFDDFLACRGNLVEKVTTRTYGTVDVYAIDWKSNTCQ